MFSFDVESITKGIGVITASLALIGGGYTLWDKIEDKTILTWAPEYFSISDAPANGTFDVIVAREKHRDDCSVKTFTLEVKDSKYIVHTAKPSLAKFSGPASDKIDKFGFSFTIEEEHVNMINPGTAALLARIDYECPEGPVVVNYPYHDNLKFKITEGK
jgi:hypothetical protein